MLAKPRELIISDRSTGLTYRLPIEDGTISARSFRALDAENGDGGLLIEDPGLRNTAWCTSAITRLGSNDGTLRYRGYRIEELARVCSYEEVAHLLIEGELPTSGRLRSWRDELSGRRTLSSSVNTTIESFPPSAQPASVMVASIAALQSERTSVGNDVSGKDENDSALDVIAKLPLLAAAIKCRLGGERFIPRGRSAPYVEQLVDDMFVSESDEWRTAAAALLETLFIVQADHEQNCGTLVVRSVSSAETDLFLSIAAGVVAASGYLHGAAPVRVVEMLRYIHSAKRVRQFVAKAKLGRVPLCGFGHEVYRGGDPRARILREAALAFVDRAGCEPTLETALELERCVAADEDMQAAGLQPAMEFFSGPIYCALRLPPGMFAVMFAIPRAAGWIAQRRELIAAPLPSMVRPRQRYCGIPQRTVKPIGDRTS